MPFDVGVDVVGEEEHAPTDMHRGEFTAPAKAIESWPADPAERGLRTRLVEQNASARCVSCAFRTAHGAKSSRGTMRKSWALRVLRTCQTMKSEG